MYPSGGEVPEQYAKPRVDGKNDNMERILVSEGESQNQSEDGFEIIHAAEGRSWRDRDDVGWCRIKGDTFPLSEIAHGELWVDLMTGRYVRSIQHQGMWVISSSVVHGSQEKEQLSRLQKPFRDGVDPVSKVIILSNLLKDIGRKGDIRFNDLTTTQRQDFVSKSG